MYCKYCGNLLDQDSNYCSTCGKGIKYPVNDAEDSTINHSVYKNNLSTETRDKVQNKKQSWYESRTTYFLFLIWMGLTFAGNITMMLIGDSPIKPSQGYSLAAWCGLIAAIIAKKNGKPGWRWFFIGFLPIGCILYFLIVVFRAIISG
jgi:hypothetical protein